MNIHQAKQKGFSLIEIMVGLVIGMLATLVIMNVFSVFEQQKRTTTGSSDAQTNGAVALFNVQRDVQNAGYGLPVYFTEVSPFSCPVNTAVDHDNNAGTPTIGLSPIVITDGNGANGSDTISIRTGNSMQGGIAIAMEAGTAANVAQVDNNMGCAINDVALLINETTPGGPLNCSMTRVTALAAVPARISLAAVTNVAVGNSLSCLGAWNEIQYAVTANQLTRSGALTGVAPNIVPNAAAVPIVPDIVNVQAQYGISAAPNNNQVVQWVDATVNAAGDFANPSLNNRNRIKAIRIAVVARNGELERANVTAACSSLITAAPTGLCAWDATSTNPAIASPAPAINLAADVNWQRYRYRVYESIIPIKSVIWARCVFDQTCA